MEERAGAQPGLACKPTDSELVALDHTPSTSSVAGTMVPPSRPAAKGVGVPEDTANKAARPQGQAPTQLSRASKRPGSFPGTSAPVVGKKPKETTLNYPSAARGLLVGVIPKEYPQV